MITATLGGDLHLHNGKVLEIKEKSPIVFSLIVANYADIYSTLINVMTTTFFTTSNSLHLILSALLLITNSYTVI